MITDDDVKKLKKVFATKDDLKGFSTMKDLNKFATKKDMNKFATKKDLNKFATKKDLELYATKSELHDELRTFKNEIFDKMDEKYSLLFNLIDPVLKELSDNDEARNIFSHRIEDHEKRIAKVEKVVLVA
ncbi:hypothetical protein KBC75_03860 [Candidatus Shapirobacteria bacterium]|nr:hypothetical protein [Candidatus Shapirobacteria bacterium]